MERTKIFVSYSHKDMDWVSKDGEYKLIAWLSEQLEDEAIVWTDHALQNLVGEEFKQHIYDRIRESNIVILLISQNFVSSKFIMDTELPFIKELLEAQKIKILPILLTDLSISGKQKISWIFDLQIYPGETKTLIELTQDKNQWIKSQIGILNNIQTRIANLNRLNQFIQKETENLIIKEKLNIFRFSPIKIIALLIICLTLFFAIKYYIFKDEYKKRSINTINYSELSDEEKANSFYKEGIEFLRSGNMILAQSRLNKALNYENNSSRIIEINKRLAFVCNKITENANDAIAFEKKNCSIAQIENEQVSRSNISFEK